MYLTKNIFIFLQLIFLTLASAFSAQSANEVDTTFNGAAYGELANQGSVNVIKTQPDGKILIGGSFTEVQGFSASGLARINADGTVDKTFVAPDFVSFNSNNGQSALGAEVFSIVVLADGKILVGGNIRSTGTTARAGIRRLNADGSIDTSFFIQEMSLGSIVYDIKLQSDGKIMIGGVFSITNTSTKYLARLNADGTHDPTFFWNVSNIVIKEVEIQPDGKIIAGGFNAGSAPILYRFNTDGSADSSFSSIESGNGNIEAVELQADGKIVIAGGYTTIRGNNNGRISRLNADGTFDVGFNPGGIGANGAIYDIAFRTDEKILISGAFSGFNGTPVLKLARLNATGSLDNTFTNNGTFNNDMNDVEILSDNSILVGLASSALTTPLLKFNPDGAFDTAFVVRITRGGKVYEILQQPDGKIIVAGEFLYANNVERRSIARFNTDGSLDTSFVPYFNNVSPLQIINTVALQSDGKILVGSTNGIVLQRLNSDGSQDTSFNAALPSSSTVYDILVQSDGKIAVVGNMTITVSKFARFNADGSRDTAFNPPQPNNYVRKIIIQPDGKFLICGVFSQISDIGFRRGIARYTAIGGLDSTFTPPQDTLSCSDMDLQNDGKIVIGGSKIQRFNTDGTLDTTLDRYVNAEVSAIKIQPDGKILVGGGFSVIGLNDPAFKNGIARFNSNGTLDNSFTASANAGVFDIQLQTDDKILLGGSFTKISGIPATRVARLLNPAMPQSTDFDYDGDGRADVSVFRASENRWYLFRSSDNTVIEQFFGTSGDVVSPADYDGDGKTDIGIFRPSTGDWWYQSSINNQQIQNHWGANGDIPRPSDFDGDGKADFIIFRPAENNWYRFGTTAGVSVVNFGLAGDKPVIGDFDGDGKSDVAIYRPSTGDWWYRSSINGAQLATRWGISTDIPAPADYDGDGKTDFAVYRPSTGVWYVINSSNGSFTIMAFGISEDKPVPADYDGDGKADIAVFRPSTGIWYQMRSTAGFAAQQFGISTDIPTPNSFVP